MTTSGTTSFNLSVDELVREAFAQIGSQPIGGADAQQARRYLNLLFIDLTNRGVPLSKVDLKTTALTSGQSIVTLASNDIDVVDIVITRTSTDYPLKRYSLSEYLRIPNKTTRARPTIYTVDRDRDQTYIKLWPVEDTSTDTITYYVTTKIEDVTKATETIDLPVRYLTAITYGLAWMLSGIRQDVPLDRRQELKAMYEEALKLAREEDSERTISQVLPWSYLNP